MRMTIGRARRATWSLPPSTPPEEALAGRTGSYAVFCTPPGGERRKLRDLVLRRGERVRAPACA
jgi:hypothetical protein